MENIGTQREVDINILPIYKHRLNLKLDIDKQTNFEISKIKKIEIINLKNNIHGNNLIYNNNNNPNNNNNINLKKNNLNIQNKFTPNTTFQIVNNESISLMSQMTFIQQSNRLLKEMNTGLNNLKTEPEFRLKNGINYSPNQICQQNVQQPIKQQYIYQHQIKQNVQQMYPQNIDNSKQ
jgi:hypothetical protein